MAEGMTYAERCERLNKQIEDIRRQMLVASVTVEEAVSITRHVFRSFQRIYRATTGQDNGQ